MCGLAGFIDCGGLAGDLAATAEAMAGELARRGPDGRGVWCDPQHRVAMGFRRLAIHDPSPAGDQPMESPSGRFVAMLNGEIHNFASLRREAERVGVAFRGRSDTEAMLACFDRHGVEASLRRFVGMFAIAVWDRQERRLHLVRDRLGVKPLFIGLASPGGRTPPDDPLGPWPVEGGSLLFASQPRALRRFPGLRLDLDHAAIARFLELGFVPAPWSSHRAIRVVPPGCMLTVAADAAGRWVADGSRWWSLHEAASRGASEPFDGTAAEAMDLVEPLLREAVSIRLAADVPVGVFLSGGIDSAAVAAAAVASRGPLQSFSVGFEDPAFDESAAAAAAAAALGCEHETLRFTADHALDLLDDLPEAYDEPFADSSQLPALFLAREVRGGITVALSGDGGDEVFGGYERYRAVPALWRAMQRLPMPLRRSAAALLRTLPVEAIARSLQPLMAALPASFATARPADRARFVATLLDARSDWELYRRTLSLGGDAAGLLAEPPERPAPLLLDDARWLAEEPDLQRRMMNADLLCYLPDDVLAKVDRGGMAHGLEVREPLLDHRLLEAMLAMPTAMRTSGSVTKPLLRRIVAERFGAVLAPQPKMGFAVPLRRWLLGPLRGWSEELLSSASLASDGLLRPEGVAGLQESLARGEHRAADRLWAVLMLLAWRRRWR